MGLIAVWVLGFKYYTYSQTDAIYEAVVRDLATNPAGDCNPKGCNVFFVQIGGQDASAEFLNRFNGAPFSVRKASQGNDFNRHPSGRITQDIAGNGEGMVVRFNSIMWLRPSEPLVWVGGDGFQMTRDYGTWRVQNRMIMGG